MFQRKGFNMPRTVSMTDVERKYFKSVYTLLALLEHGLRKERVVLSRVGSLWVPQTSSVERSLKGLFCEMREEKNMH